MGQKMAHPNHQRLDSNVWNESGDRCSCSWTSGWYKNTTLTCSVTLRSRTPTHRGHQLQPDATTTFINSYMYNFLLYDIHCQKKGNPSSSTKLCFSLSKICSETSSSGGLRVQFLQVLGQPVLQTKAPGRQIGSSSLSSSCFRYRLVGATSKTQRSKSKRQVWVTIYL